jgi:hypothetical protein
VHPEDLQVVQAGIAALRFVATRVRGGELYRAENSRALLIVRDLESVAARLEEAEEWEWELGPGALSLAPLDIGTVISARELLHSSHSFGSEDDRDAHNAALRLLEGLLRRIMNCWS